MVGFVDRVGQVVTMVRARLGYVTGIAVVRPELLAMRVQRAGDSRPVVHLGK